jgi:hypothetical protein
MFKPILVPHGVTDLIDAPVQSMIVYGTITPLVYHLPVEIKTGLLVAASMYHLRHDVPFGPTGNVLMHMAWIWQPWFAHFYLTWIHTPRHYHRNLILYKKEKIIAISIMTVITIADMMMKFTTSWKQYWWIGPVISHTIMTEYLEN